MTVEAELPDWQPDFALETQTRDAIKPSFRPVTSASGTKRTWHDVRLESVMRSNEDIGRENVESRAETR